MFSIPNLILFDKISTENEKSHPDNQGTATVAIAGISASATSAQELVVRNVLVLTRCPANWKAGKRVKMNNDGMRNLKSISCENLKVKDTGTSSRIACLTRWAPGKQVQILSVLLTRSV